MSWEIEKEIYLTNSQIDHWLMQIPSLIARQEEVLAEAQREMDEAKNLYEQKFSSETIKSLGTSEDKRKADAINGTKTEKENLVKAQENYNKQKALYHEWLNKHESIIELARNRRAEIKSSMDGEIK